MRRISFPLILVLSVAAGCGGSDSDPAPRAPYVAAPVADGVAGSTSFLQFVPVEDADDAVFPGAANYWDVTNAFGMSDGSDDQFDGALFLRVGTLPTKPATWDSVNSELGGLPQFPGDQDYSDLAFYEPVLGAASMALAAVADTSYRTPLAGTYSAFLAQTADSRLQQVVDLAAATGTVTLSWIDGVNASAGYFNETAGWAVVVRSATTGEVLETAFAGTSASGTHTFDLTAHAGQQVVLSFELRSSIWGQAAVDEVSITDGDATEFVVNGDFETGDLAGWATATPGVSQNVVGGARTLAGLEVTRGFYTAPGSLWARWVDVFENTGASPVTTDVVYRTNLGSDGAGIIYDTPGAGGRAITTWDGMAYDRDLAFVYGTGQALYVSNTEIGTWTGGEDDVYVLHTITVPAGGKVAIVHFVLMSGLDTGSLETTVDATARATAMDAAAAALANGVGNDPAYLDWMTAGQREATLANW